MTGEERLRAAIRRLSPHRQEGEKEIEVSSQAGPRLAVDWSAVVLIIRLLALIVGLIVSIWVGPEAVGLVVAFFGG